MKSILLLLTLSGLLSAQSQLYFGANDSFTASAGESLTIQTAAGASKSVFGTTISGSVTAAGNLCLFWNGTAATATSLTTSALPSPTGTASWAAPSSVATAWKSSNVGTGTSGPCWTIQAGLYTINVSPYFTLWYQANTSRTFTQNFTATFTPTTGTASGQINASWSEQ